MDEILFSLDVGTRKVCGILTKKDGDLIKVIDCEIIEHSTRSMLAGQIHDVDKVAGVVITVKERLQQRNGLKLQKASVAVAGRNLRTCRGQSFEQCQTYRPISVEESVALEAAALQDALKGIDGQENYCCVGYSVVNYTVDGENRRTLAGQCGAGISVEVLATFLPRGVLENIYSTLDRAGLEVGHLTLEPIAALEAVIPKDLRRLSLALVDIGAGTSDIAITQGGSVIAYGMVPHAGDDITDAIGEAYLLDFTAAERVKRHISSYVEKTEAENIFGRLVEFTPSGMHDLFSQKVERLAGMIANEIKALCGPAPENCPRAVVLVGGGSLIPGIDGAIAKHLGIEPERVGRRVPGREGNVFCPFERLLSPEGATPLGITMMTYQGNELSLLHVTVNEKQLAMVNINRSITVLAALLSCGIPLTGIYGRPGLARTVVVNGSIKIFKGKPPVPAIIERNGEPATLDMHLTDGDRIRFVPARDGEEACPIIAEVIGPVPAVFINGEETFLPVVCTMNGETKSMDAEAPDRSEINYEVLHNVKDVLSHSKCRHTSWSPELLSVEIDGVMRTLTKPPAIVLIDGRESTGEEKLEPGSRIEVIGESAPVWRIGELVDRPPAGKSLRVKVNDEEFIFEGGRGKIIVNGKESGADEPVANGDIIKTVCGRDAEAILVDIFRHVSVDPKDKLGKRMRLTVNEREAAFTEPLTDGAEVKLFFE